MDFIGSKETVASFDVDAQQCFTPLCPEELPVPEGDTIVQALNEQARFAQYRLGSKDAHSAKAVWVANEKNRQLTPVSGYPNADLYWNLHAVPGTQGFELLEGLPEVTDYDYFVWKGIEPTIHPYGACYHDQADQQSTGVIEFLRQKGVDTVLVGGLALDFCVKTTVLQLRQAGFRVIVNRAATRGLSKGSVDQALQAMTEAGTEFIDSTESLRS